MGKVIRFFIVLCIILPKKSSVKIGDLNERLEQFEACNIRVTAKYKTIDFELFCTPLMLLDTHYKKD